MKDTCAGLEALLAVRPQWTRLALASKSLALDGRRLLHAGPPLADPRQPPAPILSSAVLACLYEGWAQTEAEAEQLVRSGAVQLSPAQDHRCVTPLAALVSPSTMLIVMEDAASAVAPVCAPLGTLAGPDLRFGTRDRAILDRLKLRDGEYTQTLAAALTAPIELLPIAARAVTEGDDLHNRTTAATAALAEVLASRLVETTRSRDELLKGLAATPLFFLTFWMAAAKLMLSAAEHKAPSTLVTRMAGNGEVFGLSLAGRPDVWITMPATSPTGPRLPGANAANAASAALGAIGDSAVIDALGFGGQALHLAPEPHGALKPFLPADAYAPAMLHPAFAGVRVGLDAEAIVKGSGVPVVTLGMVEATGREGLLGRGVFLPGKALFENAMRALGQ
jgi:hypothetical protein